MVDQYVCRFIVLSFVIVGVNYVNFYPFPPNPTPSKPPNSFSVLFETDHWDWIGFKV